MLDEKDMKRLVGTLMILSVVIILLLPIWLLWRRKRRFGQGFDSGSITMLKASGIILLAVALQRFAVAFYGSVHQMQGFDLKWWEEIPNSLIHGLQTFGGGENYTFYLTEGRKMMVALFGENWAFAYGVMVSVLSVVTPVMGGALFFEILVNFFPRIKLWKICTFPTRRKFIFSELNDASLALAENILTVAREERKAKKKTKCPAERKDEENAAEEQKALEKAATFLRNKWADVWERLQKPAVIFMNVNGDNGDEAKNQRMLSAKRLGAVCVKEDLVNLWRRLWGERSFFLIEEKEENNLQALVKLATSDRADCLKKAKVFLFVTSDAYQQVEKRVVKDILVKEKGFADPERTPEENGKKPPLPVIVPVNSNRNLVSNLLVQVPLYEPIIHKPRGTDGTKTLSVTIMGNGSIGVEMFLATYWFGQMLDCDREAGKLRALPLKINVISQETEKAFWDKIGFINPEIRRTTQAGDRILQINPKGDMAPAYCEVQYLQEDVRSAGFINTLEKEEFGLLDSDYFFVGLGSDSLDISVADMVRRCVGKHYVEKQAGRNTVITYVVFDPALADALNRKQWVSCRPGKNEVYMQAVGSLREVYSVENIFMTRYDADVLAQHENYLSRQQGDCMTKEHLNRLRDDYKYWANLSRRMHRKYKAFSMGFVEKSLFDFPGDRRAYEAATRQAVERFVDVVDEHTGTTCVDVDQLHRMAWMEHRRWNAFTRVKGFRCPESYYGYGQPSVYKQMDLKLHPCLVECDQKGLNGKVELYGRVTADPYFDGKVTEKATDKREEDFDYLDLLAYDLLAKGFNGYDFKQHDYPCGDCT